MTKLTKEQRFRLSSFHQTGGSVIGKAKTIVGDTQWMDEANNIALDVAYRCQGLEHSLRAVLKDARATRVFLRNLRRVLG